MQRVTQYLTLFHFVPHDAISYINVQVAILGASLICGLMYLFYGFINLPKKMTPLLVWICFAISFNLSTILYVPALGMLLLGIKCNYAGTSYVSSVDPSYNCLEGTHLMIVFISIAGITALCTIASFYKAFIFNPTLTFDDPAACLTPASSLSFHAVRSILILIIVYGPLFEFEEVPAIITLVVLAGYLIYRINLIGYYYQPLNKFCIVVAAVAVWISGLNAFVDCLKPDFSAAVIGGIYECGAGIIALSLILHKKDVFQATEPDSSDTGQIQSCMYKIRICMVKNVSKKNERQKKLCRAQTLTKYFSLYR